MGNKNLFILHFLTFIMIMILMILSAMITNAKIDRLHEQDMKYIDTLHQQDMEYLEAEKKD